MPNSPSTIPQYQPPKAPSPPATKPTPPPRTTMPVPDQPPVQTLPDGAGGQYHPIYPGGGYLGPPGASIDPIGTVKNPYGVTPIQFDWQKAIAKDKARRDELLKQMTMSGTVKAPPTPGAIENAPRPYKVTKPEPRPNLPIDNRLPFAGPSSPPGGQVPPSILPGEVYAGSPAARSMQLNSQRGMLGSTPPGAVPPNQRPVFQPMLNDAGRDYLNDYQGFQDYYQWLQSLTDKEKVIASVIGATGEARRHFGQ